MLYDVAGAILGGWINYAAGVVHVSSRLVLGARTLSTTDDLSGGAAAGALGVGGGAESRGEARVPDAGADGPGSGLDDATLKSAFNAFKKRYKLWKLDQESRLGGHRPTSAGLNAAGVGIKPPDQFPLAAYQELAKQGRIKDMGGGYFAMV